MVYGSQLLTLLHSQTHRVLHYIATTVSRAGLPIGQQDHDRTLISVCMLSEKLHQVLGRSRCTSGEGSLVGNEKPSVVGLISILSRSCASKWGRSRCAKQSRNFCTPVKKLGRWMHGAERWLFESRQSGRVPDPIGCDHGLNRGRCSDQDTSPIHCHPDFEHPSTPLCPDPTVQVYSRACSVIQMPACGGAFSTKGSRTHPIRPSCHAMGRLEVG